MVTWERFWRLHMNFGENLSHACFTKIWSQPSYRIMEIIVGHKVSLGWVPTHIAELMGINVTTVLCRSIPRPLTVWKHFSYNNSIEKEETLSPTFHFLKLAFFHICSLESIPYFKHFHCSACCQSLIWCELNMDLQL